MDLRIGRYISLPDIEAQLAPNNYTYSHSILYTYDCYTQLGANATVKLNDHWTVQGGVSPGCDTMPWTTDAKGHRQHLRHLHLAQRRRRAQHLRQHHQRRQVRLQQPHRLLRDLVSPLQRALAHRHRGLVPVHEAIRRICIGTTPALPKSPRRPGLRHNGAGVNLNFGAVCQDPRLPAAQQSAYCYAPEWAITNYLEHNFWNNHRLAQHPQRDRGRHQGPAHRHARRIYEEHMVGFDFWSGIDRHLPS
jgi:hypothetical protein